MNEQMLFQSYTEQHYVIVQPGTKVPVSGTNFTKGVSWDVVKNFPDFGIIPSEPYIVLDFDTPEETEAILRVIDATDLKCKVVKTTKGVHVWLKSEKPWSNTVGRRLAIGLNADCRSYGKRGYALLKSNGQMREILRNCADDEVEYVPKWLYPIPDENNKFDFLGMGDGDGRNGKLFSYILKLQKHGFDRNEIKDTLTIVNECVFEDPLDDTELDTIFREKSFIDDDDLEDCDRRVPLHVIAGEELIAKHHIINVRNTLYTYDEAGFYNSEKNIETYLVEDDCPYRGKPNKFRAEVMKYIALRAELKTPEVEQEPFVINVVNGRLNLATGVLEPHSHEHLDLVRIPLVYDPNAYSADVDHLLNKVFCNDADCLKLFAEMLGDCLMSKNIYQKAFMFYGTGSNGKSTILNLIQTFVGPKNCSRLGLDQFTKEFNVAELENKLVNLGDDINYKPIQDSGTLKKIFSGEPMTVQRKFERPFNMAPFATQIFSCNEIPKNSDRSDGMSRRWCFVPFNAVISKDDADYDPLILEKVTTQESMSYLLNLAVAGFQRLRAQGYFTEPQCVIDTKREYDVSNSSVLSWMDDAGVTVEQLVGVNKTSIYPMYITWCEEARVSKPLGKIKFFKEIMNNFKFLREIQGADGVRRFKLQDIEDAF